MFNIAAIQEIYDLCPEDKEVDHIVPWNLQYLSKPDNIRKHNHHDSEEFWNEE